MLAPPRLLQLVLLIVTLPGAGCASLEPRTPNPFSKAREPVTASQLASEAERWQVDQENAGERERAEAERAMRRAQRDARLKALRVRSTADVDLATIESELGELVADAGAVVAHGDAERARSIAAMQAAVDGAVADLNRQREQRASLLKLAESIPGVTSVPGLGTAITTLGALLVPGAGVGGILMGARGRKAAVAGEQRARSDLALERQHHAETERAAELVVDSIDHIKDVRPEVGQAFSDLADDLNAWQGLAGKALVDRLQRGELRTRAA